MSFWFIPIRMPTVEIEVHADRRLVFQVCTAWGAAGPDGKPVSKVLREEDDGRLLIEFHTPVKGLLGRTKVNRTVEWVTLREPEQVDFQGVEGPLPRLQDRFTLEEWEACTRFKYDSTFALHGSVLGWTVGMLYVRPILKRFMRDHSEEWKKIVIEERARRSKLYPQKPCPHEPAGNDDAREGDLNTR